MNNSKTIGFIINEASTFEPIEFTVKDEYKDRVIAEGILQEAEKVNRNKRCYTREDLFREINSAKTKELVSSGNFVGEAGHPSSTDLARQSKVDPTLEQVRYIKLWMDGDLVMGHFMGTSNALGEAFDKDLRMGCKPSFSLRALGSIENRGGKAYVKNLKIITYDRVYYPSHQKAYTTKIISEGADFMQENFLFKTPNIVKESGNIQEVEEGYQLIVPISNKTVIDYIVQESSNLNTIIANFDTIYESIRLSEDCRQITLITKDYDTIVLPLERHVKNEIMNFCCKL